MVEARWRFERAGRIEKCIAIESFDSPEGKMAQGMIAKGDPLNRIERYRSSILRTYHRCAGEIQKSDKWSLNVDSTKLALIKYNQLLDQLLLKAPIPRVAIPIVKNEANPSAGRQERPQPYIRSTPKVGRNELCPCGSGLKFKKCCLDKPSAALKSAA
jgi:hypothetical protein